MIMGLKDLHLKSKALRLRRFLIGDGGSSSEWSEKEASWMTVVSHGYHVVEGRRFRIDQSVKRDSDTVVVQREDVGNLEVWYYGVSDVRVGIMINRYVQSHLFDRKPKESGIRRKTKEAMKKAYLNARADFKEVMKRDHQQSNIGSVSAVVINAEKTVVAVMGDYKAVVCKNGMGRQLGAKHQYEGRRHWPRRFLKGAMRIPKVRVPACGSTREASSRSSKRLELIIADERVNSDTEFIILCSNGVWEVMKNQEAVNLIRHIHDPQEAAECLAREALTRFSKSSIACLVIRFD